LNNIWYDKIEPFQSAISNQIRLLLSVCTFGLLAPMLVAFRKEQYFDEHKQMIVNQRKEEELKLRKIKR
jgi:hypothetical protein